VLAPAYYHWAVIAVPALAGITAAGTSTSGTILGLDPRISSHKDWIHIFTEMITLLDLTLARAPLHGKLLGFGIAIHSGTMTKKHGWRNKHRKPHHHSRTAADVEAVPAEEAAPLPGESRYSEIELHIHGNAQELALLDSCIRDSGLNAFCNLDRYNVYDHAVRYCTYNLTLALRPYLLTPNMSDGIPSATIACSAVTAPYLKMWRRCWTARSPTWRSLTRLTT
jgi:hypothetical protein